MRRISNASGAEAGPSGAVASASLGEGATMSCAGAIAKVTNLHPGDFDVERIGALLPAVTARGSV